MQNTNQRIAEGGLRPRALFKSSRPNLPLVSVVTVTYNAALTLERCIVSVLGQSYDNVEFLVIDGGSSDATLTIIRSYDHGIDYWVSEPDAGIFDAMNKGVHLARGDFVGILNADDFYEPNAVEISMRAIQAAGVDFSYGQIRLLNGGKAFAIQHPAPRLSIQRRILQEMPFPHISMFVKRDMLLGLGPFDTTYRLAADHDFAVRLVKCCAHGIELQCVVANMAIGGASSRALAQRESLRIAIRHGKGRFAAYATYMVQLLRRVAREALPISVQRRISTMFGMDHEWLE